MSMDTCLGAGKDCDNYKRDIDRVGVAWDPIVSKARATATAFKR